MELSYSDAVTYMTAPKRLVRPGGWTQKVNRENRSPVAFFEARLSLNSEMPRGLKFRISVFPQHRHSATFQMELDQPNIKTCLALYRMEWRAIAGHGNGMSEQLSDDLRGAVYAPGDTHAHSCLDHVTGDGLRVRSGGVHAARKIDPDFLTYDDALEYVCATLAIMNPGDVPPSGVQWPLSGI